eukprot:4250793-Lingulodinium_polyedra.AAC.1
MSWSGVYPTQSPWRVGPQGEPLMPDPVVEVVHEKGPTKLKRPPRLLPCAGPVQHDGYVGTPERP